MDNNQKKELFLQAWKEVLGVKEAGENDNFFEVGGDSIKGVQLVAWLAQKGLKLDMLKLYTEPTVSQMINELEEAQPIAVPAEMLTKENFNSFIQDPVAQKMMQQAGVNGSIPPMNGQLPPQGAPQQQQMPQAPMQLCTPQQQMPQAPMHLCTPQQQMPFAPMMQMPQPPMQLCTPMQQMPVAPQQQMPQPQMQLCTPMQQQMAQPQMQLCTPMQQQMPQAPMPQMPFAPMMQMPQPPMPQMPFAPMMQMQQPPMQLCTPQQQMPQAPMQLCTPQQQMPQPPMQLCTPQQQMPQPQMQLCTPMQQMPQPQMQLCTPMQQMPQPQMQQMPGAPQGSSQPFMGMTVNAPIENPVTMKINEPRLGPVTKSPEDALDTVLRSIFLNGYDKQANLFEQGLDSLKIMQIVTRSGEQGYRVNMQDIMKDPTFKGIVACMKTE